MSHEIQDFQADVVARSHEMPVLVDFWAEWCGPCRSLGPVLEKLEGEAAGTWVLAKVDVDSNQQVAVNYQVQGIPAVKLFVGGEVVAEFTGALPESQVARWLDANMPSEEKASLGEAIQRLQSGDRAGAKELLAALAESEPEGGSASVLLAQVTVFDDPERALSLVAGIGAASEHVEVATDVRVIAGLLSRATEDLPDNSIRDEYAAALDALRSQAFGEALEHFIGVLSRNKRYEDDGARKGCIAIFNHLGRDHPLAVQFRRRFQSALN